MTVRIKEIFAKSIITKSKLPDADYVVNPYIGCQFACAYCYSSFMGRFVDEPISEWGKYVYIKKNCVELFQAEICRIISRNQQGTLFFSSVTDPYQGLEKQYGFVRKMLKICADEKYPNLVSILTKSPLVTRDIDILKNLPNVEVGLTVTTTDDHISRFLEMAAPSASRRIKTLKELNDAGLRTYAFVGPLLPHFRYRSELLDDLFKTLSDAGVRTIYAEHINISKYIRARLWPKIDECDVHTKSIYEAASTTEHRYVLNKMVLSLAKKYDFELRFGKVIYHGRDI